MQVRISVTGSTLVALEQRMQQEVNSFLTGAPEGTQSAIEQIMPAEKTGEIPAGFDNGNVLTLPEYTLTYIWNIATPVPEE